jgi:hypothetical protein
MTTRADIELELVSRVGAALTIAGMDGVTVNGTNASLNGTIGYAIRTAGGTVIAPALVTDADVATVASADYDLLLDLAELRTLENVYTNYTDEDIKAGPVELKSSQYADRLAARIAQLRSSLAITYGIGGTTQLSGGTLTLNFMETDLNS